MADDKQKTPEAPKPEAPKLDAVPMLLCTTNVQVSRTDKDTKKKVIITLPAGSEHPATHFTKEEREQLTKRGALVKA